MVSLLKLALDEQQKKETKMAEEDPLSTAFRRMSVTLDQNSQILLTNMQAMKDLASASRMFDPASRLDVNRIDKVVVEVKCSFLKLVDIDTVNQFFKADIFVQAKWQEPAFDEIPEEELPEFDIDIHWDPKLTINNVDDTKLDRKTYDIRYEKGYRYPLVFMLWRVKGTFTENMELEHFPFDVQDLSVQVVSERPYESMVMIEDQQALSTVNVKSFLDAQEWNIYNHVETLRDRTTMEYASTSHHHIIYITCRVKRKVGYFMWNIALIVLLITLQTFTVMAIEPSNGDRIAMSITLFLTAVAFKLVVKQSLPTISYLTYLDTYILGHLLFLSMQSAQNATMCALGPSVDEQLLRDWDLLSQGVLAAMLIFCHVMFATYIYSTAWKRRRTMKYKDKLYETKIEYLAEFGKMMNNPGFKPSLSKSRSNNLRK